MKIINDTLKKPNGRWDKQALTFFVCFVISCVLGISNTIFSYVLNMTENQTANNIFDSFMILTGALSGVNVANKLADSKVKNDKNEENE